MPKAPVTVLLFDGAWVQAMTRFHPLTVVILARRSRAEYRQRAIWIYVLELTFYQWMLEPPDPIMVASL